MPNIFRSILLTVVPYKNLRLFQDYIETVRAIQVQDRCAGPKAHIYLILALWLFINMRYYYLIVWPSISDLERVIQANMVYLILNRRDIYILITGTYFMAAYFYYKFYLCIDPRLLNLFSDMLFDRERSNQLLLGLFIFGYRPFEVIRFGAYLIVNLAQIIIIVMDSYLIYYDLFCLEQTNQYLDYFFSSPIGLLSYVYHWFNVLMIDLSWICFLHICILAATFGFIAVAGLYIRAVQSLHLLRRQASVFSWTHLEDCLRNDVRTFEYIFLGNVMIGDVFAAFLIVNFPINSYFVMMLYLSKTKGLYLFFAVFIISQGTCIFVMHLCIGLLTSKIYHSSKVLLSAMVHNQHRVGQFRARFRVANAIIRLHTKAKCGITYGCFGLVTIPKFAKCLLIYCEFLMYAYQLIIKN